MLFVFLLFTIQVVNAGAVIINDVCQMGDIKLSYDFENARVNGCELIDNNEIILTISPENSPINHSPWYAFKIESEKSKTVLIRIKYTDVKGIHRYKPKLIQDQFHWQPIDHIALKKQVLFKLEIGPEPILVAGQEIIINEDYDRWMGKLAKKETVNYSLLGQSTQNRDIGMLEILGEGKEWVILLGRQHPPEVTGALAFFPFVNTLVEDSDLVKQFNKRFNVLVIPDLNPDGVALGNWRHTSTGVDLNRDWGDFKQKESRLVRDKLKSIIAKGGKIVFAVDFHSTGKDVFYTMGTEFPGVKPAFLVKNWLESLQSSVVDFKVRRTPAFKTQGVFKQYIAKTYGVHAITYEVGDHTERRKINTVAFHAANTMMQTLLKVPESEF